MGDLNSFSLFSAPPVTEPTKTQQAVVAANDQPTAATAAPPDSVAAAQSPTVAMASPPAVAAAPPPPPPVEDGRGGLLEAIRAAGGAKGAGLKSHKVRRNFGVIFKQFPDLYSLLFKILWFDIRKCSIFIASLNGD